MVTKKGRKSLRDIQRPLKQAYKEDPGTTTVTMTARASMNESGPYACNTELAHGTIEAQAHAGVGGPGTAACSAELLLGALAACTQITVQMVAASMGLSLDEVQVEVQGALDVRGTLGLSRDVPVGFQSIRSSVHVQGDLEPRQLKTLQKGAERYCVVLATLQAAPTVQMKWSH